MTPCLLGLFFILLSHPSVYTSEFHIHPHCHPATAPQCPYPAWPELCQSRMKGHLHRKASSRHSCFQSSLCSVQWLPACQHWPHLLRIPLLLSVCPLPQSFFLPHRAGHKTAACHRYSWSCISRPNSGYGTAILNYCRKWNATVWGQMSHRTWRI